MNVCYWFVDAGEEEEEILLVTNSWSVGYLSMKTDKTFELGNEHLLELGRISLVFLVVRQRYAGR